MAIENTNLVDAIREALRNTAEGIHVSLPGEVQSYDAAKQTVDVQPVIKRVYHDNDGNEVVENYPQIPKVPVAWPRYGDFVFTMPIAAGDMVTLIFSDRSIDRWRSQGGTVDPGDLRVHDLSFAVAIPCGAMPTSKALGSSDVSTVGAWIGKVAGPGVHVTGSAVELGGTVSVPPIDFVALAQKVLTELTRIQTYMTVLDTALRVPAAEPGNGAPSAFQTALGIALAAVTYPAPASMAATKVKAL